jgi:hypothetical protein
VAQRLIAHLLTVLGICQAAEHYPNNPNYLTYPKSLVARGSWLVVRGSWLAIFYWSMATLELATLAHWQHSLSL